MRWMSGDCNGYPNSSQKLRRCRIGSFRVGSFPKRETHGRRYFGARSSESSVFHWASRPIHMHVTVSQVFFTNKGGRYGECSSNPDHYYRSRTRRDSSTRPLLKQREAGVFTNTNFERVEKAHLRLSHIHHPKTVYSTLIVT